MTEFFNIEISKFTFWDIMLEFQVLLIKLYNIYGNTDTVIMY